MINLDLDLLRNTNTIIIDGIRFPVKNGTIDMTSIKPRYNRRRDKRI